jgi:hypothetical protein
MTTYKDIECGNCGYTAPPEEFYVEKKFQDDSRYLAYVCPECEHNPIKNKKAKSKEILKIARKNLAKRLKTEFERIKATCDLHSICIKCFEPMLKGTYVCYCDYDEPR